MRLGLQGPSQEASSPRVGVAPLSSKTWGFYIGPSRKKRRYFLPSNEDNKTSPHGQVLISPHLSSITADSAEAVLGELAARPKRASASAWVGCLTKAS